MDRLRTYKILKTNFGCEQYLFSVKNKLCRTTMTKFRGGLLRISCNEGRYNKTPLNERFCLLCNQDVDTEYHFLLVCRALSHISQSYHPYGLLTLLLINLSSYVRQKVLTSLMLYLDMLCGNEI